MSQVTATISSLAPGGDGVTHVDLRGERRAVFVGHVAAGDRVRLEVDASRRPARGYVLDWLAHGPDHEPSPCPWAIPCGGCDWMHLSLAAQQRTHVEHVRAALPLAWRDSPRIAATPAERSVGYRIRARVHVRCGRGGRVTHGMHQARSHEPVEVDRCAVLHPALEGARRQLSALFQGCRGHGEVQLALGVDRLPVLDIRWMTALAPETYARLERAVAGRLVAGAQVTESDANRPAKVGDPTPWMSGPDGQPLRLAIGGFGQASEEGNTALANCVAALAKGARSGDGVDKAVELYAGAGNLSVMLARVVGELTCIESSRPSCEAARANLAARSLDARVVEADAGSYTWGGGTKLVVLDPPRTGARSVAERATHSRVANLIYVSCDAQTLGRDLAILEAGYLPTAIATFEMFPQTSHVETVVALARRRP